MTLPDVQRTRPLLSVLLLVCSVFFAIGANAANDLPPSRVSFVGDIWCPYNCAPEAKEQGALVELLAHILAKRNIELDYQVMPWSRALQEVSEGRVDGIIGAGQADAKVAALTAQPWLHAELAALTHRDSQFVWRGLTSLTGKTVVVITNYEYAAPLPAWLAANQASVHYLSGENSFRQAIMLILHKRQDVFFSSDPALRSYLRDSAQPTALVVTKTGLRTPIFMGVAKQKPYSATLMNWLDAGFQQAVADGKVAELIARYRL